MNKKPFWNFFIGLRPIKWICDLRISKKIMENPIAKKIFNYEMITYIFFGATTTVINWVAYWLLCFAFSIPMDNPDPKDNLLSIVANSIAFVISLIYAFITNKIIVFSSKDTDFKTVAREFISFTTARLVTFGLETLILFIAGLIAFNLTVAKVFSGILVVILNYVFSKLFIFKSKE